MIGIEGLIQQLLKHGIDVEFGTDCHQHGVSSTVELLDQETDTTIGFCRRDTMEEALYYLVAKCVSHVRDVKVDYNHPDILNSSDLEEM